MNGFGWIFNDNVPTRLVIFIIEWAMTVNEVQRLWKEAIGTHL